MSSDFWAGYLSGAIGIIIGNPLDIIKVRLQAGASGRETSPVLPNPTAATTTTASNLSGLQKAKNLTAGSLAPILGYGALNALLFVTYNRCLTLLSSPGQVDPSAPAHAPGSLAIWTAGAAGGLATFIVSAPTELVKCQAQMVRDREVSSLGIAKEIWKQGGVRGFYWGGGITAVRDAVGYGFYFWSYELSKRIMSASDDTEKDSAMKILLCGGLAGVVTWASIFPLDVIKTRVQTQEQIVAAGDERKRLLVQQSGLGEPQKPRRGAVKIARETYRNEGIAVFFRGLGVCSVRAFIVNAVQWAVYEWTMQLLNR